MRECHSPALPRKSWQQFGELLRLARQTATRDGLRLRSIELVELTDDPKTAIYWLDDELKNPGFEPLQRLERQSGGRGNELLGFYTLDGTPLSFTERTDPRDAQHHILTVQLDEPLAPGKTVLILRRERRPVSIRTGRDGAQTLALGRLGPGGDVLRVRGVCLLSKMTLLNYTPQPSATRNQSDPPFVGWISDPDATNSVPVTVAFQQSP